MMFLSRRRLVGFIAFGLAAAMVAGCARTTQQTASDDVLRGILRSSVHLRTGRLVGLVEAFGTTRVAIQGGTAAPHVDIPMPGMIYVTPVSRIDEFLRAASGERFLVGRP